MCKICARVGNRYADQLTSGHRVVVDEARRACNFSRLPETSGNATGGFAMSALKSPSTADTLVARTLTRGVPHISELRAAFNSVPQPALLAFETPDDSFPDASVFKALQAVCPDVLVMRVLHRNGNVQYLTVDEALSHFMDQAQAA